MVTIAWDNCANTQRLGDSRKNMQPMPDCVQKTERKKRLPFDSYGFMTISWIFDPIAGSLSPNLTTDNGFFSLTTVSVVLAILPACDLSAKTNCALSNSKALQRVLVVLAWQNNHEQTFKTHSEVLHQLWNNSFSFQSCSTLFHLSWSGAP